MKYTEQNKEGFESIVLINPKTNKKRIAFSPVFFEKEDEETKKKMEMVGYYYTDVEGDVPTMMLKDMLVQLQKEYDKSDDVNCFLFNGEKAWLDKDTRVGLVNSCDVREKKGHEDYTVYFNGQAVTLPITVIRQILDDVEEYAMSCYAVTEQHLAEIAALATRKDILEYDITKGYPSKLEFTPNNE